MSQKKTFLIGSMGGNSPTFSVLLGHLALVSGGFFEFGLFDERVLGEKDNWTHFHPIWKALPANLKSKQELFFQLPLFVPIIFY